ncbi:hypothetical protein EPN87_01255 [archaeon]|nr:MAG: hypothetical protein EPN87_01255 [archaeon]
MKGIVIGGGLSGLGACIEMENKVDEITLVEKENHLMGVASSFNVEGYNIPQYYHHVSDQNTIDFFKQANLYDKIVEKRVKAGFYIEGDEKFSQLNKSKLLFFKPFTLHDKIKFGLMGLKLMFSTSDIRKLDKISAEEWLSKNATPHVARFFGGLLENHKFPIPFSEMSAAWLYERFKIEMGKSSILGYPKGREGWEIISDYASKKLKGNIVTNTSVDKIIMDGGYVNKIFTGNNEINVSKDDLVVCCLPATMVPGIVEGMPTDIGNKFSSIDYATNVSVVIGIEDNLSDLYWINTIGKYPFGTIIDQNNLYGEFPWRVFYISNYYDKNDPFLKMSDDEIFSYYMRYFEQIFKKKVKVLWHKVNRTPYGGAIEKVGLFDAIPTNKEFSNIKFAGQYMTYPYERSTGRTVVSGQDAVKSFFETSGNA